MPGHVHEAAADYARLQRGVQPRGHDRFFETGHHQDLEHELVVRAARLPQLLTQRALLLLVHVLDDQDLEIGPLPPGLLPRMGVAIGCVVIAAKVKHLAGTEGVSDEGPVDLTHYGGELVILPGREYPPHPGEFLGAGKRIEPLDRP